MSRNEHVQHGQTGMDHEEIMPWDPVTEHTVTDAPDGLLALVEEATRRGHPRTNPIHIKCRNGHESGASLMLGTRAGDVVLFFHSRNHEDTYRNACINALNILGPKRSGTGDHMMTSGWRLYCPPCADGVQETLKATGGTKTPEWVLREAARELIRGRAFNAERGQWPRLRLNWT
jgi:hypothetical protein